MVYIVAVLALAIDQWLGWLVRTHMTLYQRLPLLPPAFYLDYIRNPGAAFGILPDARPLFILVGIAVVVAGIYVDRRFRPGRWVKVGLGLLIAGAVGNLIDRVVFGSVTDYVYFRPIHFPVFNFADVCIDVGVAMLIVRSLIADRRRPPANDVVDSGEPDKRE